MCAHCTYSTKTFPANHKTVHLQRRRFVTSAVLIGPAMFIARPAAAAADPVTVAVALVTLVSAISNFFKASGDLELQMQNLNVKLDALLTGIEALSKITLQLAEAVAEVGEAVARTPHITNVIGLVNQIVAIEQSVRTYLSPDYKISHAQRAVAVREELKRLQMLSVQVSTGVNSFGAEPVLCMGAYSAVRTIEFAQCGLRKFAVINQSDWARSKDVLNNAANTLRAMESELVPGMETLPVRRAAWSKKVEESADKIVKSFTELSAVLLGGDFAAKRGVANASAVLSQCFKGADHTTFSRDENIWYISDPGSGRRTVSQIVGKNQAFRISTKTVHYKFQREHTLAFGGRSAYVIRPQRGVEGTYGSDNEQITGRGPVIASSSSAPFGNPAEASCKLLPAVDASDHAVIDAFLAHVNYYNECVAQESFLLMLGAQSGKVLKKIDELTLKGVRI